LPWLGGVVSAAMHLEQMLLLRGDDEQRRVPDRQLRLVAAEHQL
jgi:hypothetical protein